MRLSVLLLLVLCFCLATAGIQSKTDTFQIIKQSLKQSACVRLTFKSIIESSIFSAVDTVNGSAVIARDGRYAVTLGKDKYVFDGHDLYSFSYDNNQVTVEHVEPGGQFGAEVSFVTRLDEIYKTTILRPDSIYRLVKATRGYANVPDSLVVTIDRSNRVIRAIDYLDVNEEKNRIIFTQQSLTDACDSNRLVPDFPDSVERIRL
jgi:outer membrane lipoprotein-sorting protein